MPRNMKASIQALKAKKDQKVAEVILYVFAMFFLTLAGQDEKPSRFWEALTRIPGVNGPALELVQDVLLMVGEILLAVRDGDVVKIPSILLAHGVELYQDGQAIKGK